MCFYIYGEKKKKQFVCFHAFFLSQGKFIHNFSLGRWLLVDWRLIFRVGRENAGMLLWVCLCICVLVANRFKWINFPKLILFVHKWIIWKMNENCKWMKKDCNCLDLLFSILVPGNYKSYLIHLFVLRTVSLFFFDMRWKWHEIFVIEFYSIFLPKW